MRKAGALSIGTALVLSQLACELSQPVEGVSPLAAPTIAAPEAPNPYERSESRFGAIPLHAGFSPDPRVVSGEALGQIPARTLHRKCRGWIAQTPDYLLDADTAFLRLYILARSRSDVVLVAGPMGRWSATTLAEARPTPWFAQGCRWASRRSGLACNGKGALPRTDSDSPRSSGHRRRFRYPMPTSAASKARPFPCPPGRREIASRRIPRAC